MTWPVNVITNNIDDSYRTKGGNCRVQAINLSSVMDIVGVSNILDKSTYPVESHMIVLIPQIKKLFSNGVIKEYDSLKKNREIIGVIIKDRYVLLSYDSLYANTDYNHAVAMLEKARDQINAIYKYDIPDKIIHIQF
ncbi:MAG: hypothetical protein PWR10_1749 [Halanaerobiales bacterium]|nr:hypothetical protein [Halanaerobiales bacterium]